MKKYQNKYRIDSARLKNYDYSSDGAYFITICTKNREHFFGEIVETLHCNVSTMKLSPIGQIAQQYWNEIPRHFPFIKLDKMVVMPNHIHGVLWIDGDGGVDDADGGAVDRRDVACNVSTGITNKKMAKISPKRGSLASVIRSFKSVVTKFSREINPNFVWQPRFHDHIIRNEKSLNAICQYIIQNPEMWHRDRNNEMGLKM